MLLSYTVPISYSATHFYTRVDDKRFDADLSILNDPRYRLAIMDGEMSDTIARKIFPKASTEAIPQLADITQLLLSVSVGKADGVFLEPSLARDFARANPGKIRQATKKPFAVYPNSFGLKIGETKMQEMMDNALIEMLARGDIDRITTQYEPDRSIFMPVAKPYEFVEPAPLP